MIAYLSLISADFSIFREISVFSPKNDRIQKSELTIRNQNQNQNRNRNFRNKKNLELVQTRNSRLGIGSSENQEWYAIFIRMLVMILKR